MRNQAYRILREEIVECRLTPGALLSENELARSLGISRTPVREALRTLADERLVVVVPQQGTTVAPISAREVLEAQLVRELLERASLAVGSRFVQPDAYTVLNPLLAEQDALALAGRTSEYMKADQEFHIRLTEFTGYESLGRLTANARAHLDRLRALSLAEPELLVALTDEHRVIVDAMVAADLPTADRMLTAHLRRVLGVLPAMQAQHPDYFTDEPRAAGHMPLALTFERNAMAVS